MLAIGLGVTQLATSQEPASADKLRAQLAKERNAIHVERRQLRNKLRITSRNATRWRTAARANPSVQEALRLAAFTHGVPLSTMRRIAFCESRFNPRARNASSNASGLLQFLPSTWSGNRYGSAGFSVWSPYANAMGAAWHMSRSGTGAWECR